MATSKRANRFMVNAATSLALLCLVAGGTRCQAPDGDEAFEFQHQDIGRISGLSSGTSQVAPQTTIVTRQQPQHLPSAEPATQSQLAPQRGAQRHNAASGSQRKPNRVTLVARRDPNPSQAFPAAQVAPAAVAQLPAPPQNYAPQLQTVPSSSFELAQPTFKPQAPQEPVGGRQFASSALNTFRAPDSSVSPRHSALIAQVASERAAAAASFSPAQNEPALLEPVAAPLPAPSFGSLQPQPQPPQPPQPQPIQPKFTLAQPLQPSAFASFAASQNVPLTAAPNFQPLAAPSQPQLAVNQPEEPAVAPSFEHVLGHGCPHKGVFSWENKDHCDRYYMCTNGTFTEEACPNGLAYSQMGAVYQHCAYNWNVQCGNKKTALPIASPGCPWQFGIFPILQNGRCSIDYFVCEWGVPETKRCTPEGLFYDDRIKGCQWADQLGCKSEALLNFKCPPEDEDNPYWPYPRYYHNTQDVIVCVNEQPRLVHCNEDQLVDPGSLACLDVNKKKKKQF